MRLTFPTPKMNITIGNAFNILILCLCSC
jgi:hypothetical protein